MSPPEERPAAASPPPRIDVHVHLGGVGAGGSGISVSPRFRRSVQFRVMRRLLGRYFDESGHEDRLDQLYVDELARLVRESTELDRAVVLALDGLWRDGELDRERSPLVVPNAWARDAARAHPELLFGASVNPLRPDALDELDRVVEEGAVLLKWLPNVMGFDPGDAALRPFLRRVADLGLPILSHCGSEFSLPGGRHELGNPWRLRPALEEGVTVIAAHCATLCRPAAPDGERLPGPEVIARLAEDFPTLHADLAALASVLRGHSLRRILDDERLRPRLVEASDFPVPTLVWTQLGRVPVGQLWRARRLDNPFDLDRVVKRAAGVTEDMRRRAAGLLRLP